MINKVKCIIPILLVCSASLWADQVDTTRLVCPDERITCVEILEKIADLKQSVTECWADIQTCLEETNSLIDAFVTPTCAVSMAISQADMPFTITASGQYCLQETVTGTLTIDADDVSLNLNGFMISGGSTNNIVATGHINITIAHGVVGNAGADGNGVLLTNCTTVSIFEVKFQESETGCRFDNVQNIRMHDCSFSEHVGDTSGVLVFENGTRDGKITCCQLDNNERTDASTDIIRIANSANLVFFNVNISTFIMNVLGAGDAVGTLSSQNCIFIDCSVNNGTNGYFGFQAENCLFSNCRAQNITDNGFRFDNCQQMILNKAQAANTGIGTVVRIGQSSTLCCIIDCILQNGAAGIITESTVSNNYIFNNKVTNCTSGYVKGTNTTNGYLRNYAQNNTTNYSGFPANYSITTFDTTTGTFTRNAGGGLPRPTDWDNISVI